MYDIKIEIIMGSSFEMIEFEMSNIRIFIQKTISVVPNETLFIKVSVLISNHISLLIKLSKGKTLKL